MTLTIWNWPADWTKQVSGTCRLVRRSLTSTQPFSAFSRVDGPIDERWMLEFTMPTLGESDWKGIEGWLSRLDGLAGGIRISDPYCKYPRGAGTGANPANGGTQSTYAFDDSTTWSDGTTWFDSAPTIAVAAAAVKGAEYIHVSGLQASQTSAFKWGDKMEIGSLSDGRGLLYQVVNENVASDSSGEALVKIRPRLRAAVAAADKITIYNPTSVFRLVSEDAAIVSRSLPALGSFGISLVEIPEEVLT